MRCHICEQMTTGEVACVDCYLAACEEHAEVEWLRAIVDKLPKCWRLVDGKLVQDCPVGTGMELFVVHEGKVYPVHHYWIYDEGSCGVEIQIKVPSYSDPVLLSGFELNDCHNSREAAETALNKEKGW